MPAATPRICLVSTAVVLALSPAALGNEGVSKDKGLGEPAALWPLLEGSRKCVDAEGKFVRNQLQCQLWAGSQGHDFYQYNTARKECLTAKKCSDRVSALMWKIYHNKDQTEDDDEDDDEDDYFEDDEDDTEEDDEDKDAVVAHKSPSHVTVQLRKQYVPVYRDGSVVAYKTAYSGDIEIGMGCKPQRFSVVFDTGSGHLLLPSLQCKSEACLAHTRYNASASASVLPIDHDGRPIFTKASERDQVAIDFGTGSVVGEFAYETVCLAGANQSSDWDKPTDGPIKAFPRELGEHPRDLGRGCVRLRVVLATDMTKDPFYNFAFDGVLGLGLEGMALDPEFSFFGQLTRQLKAPRPIFGVYISRDDAAASELSFGGVDSKRFDTEMKWTPVLSPHLGYWQVAIKSIRVKDGVGEDKVLESCQDGSCIAILDTGTSLLGVPDATATILHPQLARLVPGDPEEIDCRYFPGPDLIFDMGGFDVTLTAEEYSRPTAMRVTGGAKPRTLCRASMLRAEIGPPLGPHAFILGEPVLRRYYTAYDWRSRQVGFALAKHSTPSAAAHSAELIVE